jgi:hypothetical protein
MIFIVDKTTKTASSKPAGVRMSAAPQAAGEMAEKGTAQAKENSKR